jgi:hypothetical protein
VSAFHEGRRDREDHRNEFAIRRRARENVQPMLTLDQAWQLIAGKVTELQDRQLRCALPPLTDLTDSERLFELRARLGVVEADGASMDLLAAVGAHVVAFMRAVDAREQTDPTAGGEAA